MFTCEFCGKELSTNQNLKTHQKKTKYCLDKQKLINPSVEAVKEACQYCNKTFYNNYRKFNHEEECIVKPIKLKYEAELNIQKQKYEELTATMNNLKIEYDNYKLTSEKLTSVMITNEKQKSDIYAELYNKDQQFILEQSKRLLEKSGITTTTNIKAKTITMNSLNLSQERLESIKDSYTMRDYERGGIGQADWVVENILKDESGNLVYKCTDKNRKNFIYQDSGGNIVTDIHAKKLKESIFPIMSTKLKEFKKIKCAELADISDDESELLEKYSDLYNENKSMGHEFDKRLVEKTYDRS